MTHPVLFIQGGGEDAHDKSDNRIVESLERDLGPEYAVRYPQMPHEADSKYAAWKAALKRQFYRFDGDELRIRSSHATARHAPEYLRSSAVFDCAWARSISSSI